MIIHVKIVFRKTVVGDWRFDYMSVVIFRVKLRIAVSQTDIPRQTIDGYYNNSKTTKLTNPNMTRGINTIIWWGLFTGLWRWLPLRWLICQSPTTVRLSKDYPHLEDHAPKNNISLCGQLLDCWTGLHCKHCCSQSGSLLQRQSWFACILVNRFLNTNLFHSYVCRLLKCWTARRSMGWSCLLDGQRRKLKDRAS